MPFLVTKKPAFSKFAVLELSKENKLNAPISRQIVSGFTIQIFLIHGITSLAIGRQYYILGNRSTFLNVNAGPRTRVSIVPGLFQLSSPGTFGLFQSRDHGTTGPSRSVGPVLSSPGTKDLLLFKKNLQKINLEINICFSIFATFFSKIINFLL